MLNLKGYKIQQDIYRSQQTRVSRGYRIEDGAPVILKYPAADYPSLRDIARLKSEYDILKDLGEKKVDRVVRVHALERADHLTLMVTEDFGGIPLKEYFVSNALGQEEFLQIAIAVADTLATVHQHNIIHKDINPSNILINPQSREVKLVDFDIATRLSREVQEVRSPDRLDGTLAYMSPEQTGRINRALDYRTDMYSLGATLYELLRGAPPFSSADAMELLHCHIAREPAPLVEHRVPRALSDIIAKLMAKTPEERYQSALGLKADLEECLQQLRSRGAVSPFELARRDISHKFEVPQKLYGRANEAAMLLNAFSRVSQGTTALLLVSGYSGIGKSSLIHEVQKPIVERKGYFVSGKYDQYNRDVPYSALAQALNGLIHQFLKEPASKVAAWKEEIRKAVGQNGQVIIDVIPALELLLGPQSSAPSLGPTEAQSRFNFIFEDFLSVLATEQHPLTLFLDDLQWADTPSLKLLEILVSDPRSKYLFVIAAYRDNEVDASHASMIAISEIKKTGAKVQEFNLGPLTLASIMDLLADTLHCARDETALLAELLLKKTGGNPFFLLQLLYSLHEDGLLEQNTRTGAWDWDIAKINDIGITDNVIDLMTVKLQRLPEATQGVLKLAACIGNTFDLGMLSIVHEKGERETATRLWPVVREGLVLPLSESYQMFQVDDIEADMAEGAFAVRELINDMMTSNSEGEQARIRYRFLHDRVQQATYALIPEDQRKIQHSKIGKLLLASASAERLDEDIFDIVTHLNVGRDLLATEAEKLELAKLNYKAGKKAKAAMAFTVANSHFSIALQLLPVDGWSAHYKLTLDLHREHAECKYLLGDFARSEELLTEAIAHGRSRLDKGLAYDAKIKLYMTQESHDLKAKAVSTALEALRLFDHEMPTTTEARAALAAEEKQRIARELLARNIRDLEDLPRMTDPERLLMMNLAVTLFGAAYLVGDFDLVSLGIYFMVRMSLEHGNSEASAFGYILYGMLVSAGGEYKRAYEFGELSLALNKRYPNPVIKPKVHNMFAHCVNPFINHIETNLPHYRATYECCLEGGDIIYGAWASLYTVWVKLLKGDVLHEVYSDSEQYVGFTERAGDPNMLFMIQCVRQVAQCLRGLTTSVDSLDSESFSEANCVQRLRDAQFLLGLCTHAMCREIVNVTFERHEEAVRAADLADATVGAFFGFFSNATHYFYASLALTATYADASEEQKRTHLERIEGYAAKLKMLADSCQENFLHCHQLVEAERARIRGETRSAAELYDLSVSNAQKGRFLNHEALALELAAKFYLGMERKRLACVYMSDACQAYTRWGAVAKAEQLKERYPELLARDGESPAEAQTMTAGAETPSTIDNPQSLDLGTVMKASQAVSEEIVLSKLLEKFMRIVLQNAGAQKGCLMLERGGDLLIEANATVHGRDVAILRSVPIANAEDLSQEIVRYVQRTRERVVLANAAKEGMFVTDAYVVRRQPRSVLCMPVTHQGKLVGILYLENNLTEGAFTPSRLKLLRLLSAQVAISIENSRLYGRLEEKVKERTAELREAQAKLIRFERESTERRMAGGFAHEIRNALAGSKLVLEKVLGGGAEGASPSMVTSIVTELGTIYESLEERLTDEEMDSIMGSIMEIVESQKAIEKALQFVFESSARALSITKRIMDYSMVDEQKISPGKIDLGDLMASALALLEEEIKGHNIVLTTALEKNINIRGEEVPCYSILQNLLNNARDAVLEKGTATEPGTIHVDAGVKDDRFVLRVKDNGIGIKEANLNKIFDAFYSTKPNTGTGLGLATVKKIIDVNDGSIRVESEWGKGTIFTVVMPITGILAWSERGGRVQP
jgi:predicted ATPase/signal transduction histidine kinase